MPGVCVRAISSTSVMSVVLTAAHTRRLFLVDATKVVYDFGVFGEARVKCWGSRCSSGHVVGRVHVSG